MKKILSVFLLTAFLSAICFAQKDKDPAAAPAKLTAQEVVDKHLASIGTPEDIAAVTSRVMTGEGKVASAQSDITKGAAQFASMGDKLIFAMLFQSQNYHYEKAAFDGKEQTIGHPNGVTTLLGEFLKVQSAVLKEGLLGGALSTAWPLLDLKTRNAKVSYAGTEEIEGRAVYKLRYSSRTGSMQVGLYFDANDFHHIRTEYKYAIESPMITGATNSAGSSSSYFTLTEDFSDFKKTGKLTLPMSYKLKVIKTAQGFQGSASSISTMVGGERHFTVKFLDVMYDQPLDPAVFKVS